jgi:hypothetical protein
MPVEGIVAFLRGWQPLRGFGEPSEEGLARSLSAVIQDRAAEFSAAAALFVGLDPTYVRGFFSGLRGAPESVSIAWSAVLALAAWAIAQDDEQVRPAEPGDRDSTWAWTRREIMHLLETAMTNSLPGLDRAHRAAVWGVIEPATRDPDPLPVDEARYGHPNMDPLTYSINTTRGQALHATFAYAVWTAPLGEGETSSRLPPEAVDVLDQHLDLERDGSLAIHSVYGWWLSQALAADEAWAVERLTEIFPEETEYFQAAWSAYLPRAGAGNREFELMRPVFRRAITRIGSDPEMRIIGWKGQDEALVERLVWLYAVGRLALGDELLAQLLSTAPASARTEALEQAGRLLQTDQEVPTEVVTRLRALWDSRWTHHDLTAEERATFQWWFASKHVDPAWSLPILAEVIGQGSELRFLFLIMKRLAEVAPAFPAQAVELLKTIAASEAGSWQLVTHRDETRAVLEAAVLSGDNRAKADALDLADRLGRRGLHELKDLLR